MKRSILPFVFLCSLASCQQSEVTLQPTNKPPAATAPAALVEAPATIPKAPPSLSGMVLLYDPNALASTTPPPEEQKKVLDVSFPKRLASKKECKKKKVEVDEIAAGQIVPSIVTSASGSFTVSKEPQVAYLINAGECHAEPLRDGGIATSSLLVVMSGDKLVYQDLAENWDFLSAVDIDDDGLDEVVGVKNEGWKDLIHYLEIHRFTGETFERVKTLYEPVLEINVCDATKLLEEGKDVVASRIMVIPQRPGELPMLALEKVSLTLDQKKMAKACQLKKTSSPFPKGGG